MGRTLPRLMAIAASAALLLASASADAATKKKTTKAAESTGKTTASTKEAAKPSAARHGVGKGDTEVGFLFNYTHYDSNFDNVTVGAVFGKFLRDTLELRVTPVINYTNVAGFKNFMFTPYVTVEKLFPNSSPVVPYVGGGIGLTLGTGSGTGVDTSDFGLFVTPVGGLKFFVSERMALEYALGFQVGFDYQCIDSAGYSTCATGTTTGFRNDLRFNVYF